jgi:hypothetical protein
MFFKPLAEQDGKIYHFVDLPNCRIAALPDL